MLKQTPTAKDGKEVCYNLQMQVNNRPKISSLADAAPYSVAHVEMPVDKPWSAATIKEKLKQSCLEYGDKSGYF
jgi:hypothetical protein